MFKLSLIIFSSVLLPFSQQASMTKIDIHKNWFDLSLGN